MRVPLAHSILAHGGPSPPHATTGRVSGNCWVGSAGMDKRNDMRQYATKHGGKIGGEWLYDFTCLEYKHNDDGGWLKGIPVVAECEWGNKDCIGDDFQKLLLARADVRVMIFNGNYYKEGASIPRMGSRIFGNTSGNASTPVLATPISLRLVFMKAKIETENPSPSIIGSITKSWSREQHSDPDLTTGQVSTSRCRGVERLPLRRLLGGR